MYKGESINLGSAWGFDMDEETKSKLDGLFQKDRDRIVTAENAERQKKRSQAEATLKFSELRSAFITPIAEEFAKYVKENGWVCNVVSFDEGPARVVISFHRPLPPPYVSGVRSQSAEFTISCDRSISHARLSHSGDRGGSEIVPLDELTPEKVRDAITRFLSKLLESKRTY